jgi:hypothetical protein
MASHLVSGSPEPAYGFPLLLTTEVGLLSF